MLQIFALTVLLLVAGAPCEELYATVQGDGSTDFQEMHSTKGLSLIVGGKGKVVEVAANGLADPFAELDDEFDYAMAQPTAPVTAALAAAAEKAASAPVTEQSALVLSGAGWLDTDYVLYLVFVFAAEVVVVALAARGFQRWSSKAGNAAHETLERSEQCSEQHEAKDELGCTALHAAADSGSLSDVRALLKDGADIHAREAWDQTPLHFAARRGSVEICELLLEHGAEVNVIDAQDQTPLLAAGLAGKEAVCSLLLDNGGHAGGIADKELPLLLSVLVAQRCLNTGTSA